MGNGHVPIEGERGVGGSSLFSQLKKMGGRSRPSDAPQINEQPSEKKKGFADWMNLMKPNNEVKDHWLVFSSISCIHLIFLNDHFLLSQHHCRNCGDVFCDKCTRGRIALTADENAQPVRVCDRCLAEVTQRLSNAKEAANKLACLQSHEDLAQKLQVACSKSDGFRFCTVHLGISTVYSPKSFYLNSESWAELRVQAPISGSETNECALIPM
ncbi:hypothetical protein SAY86_013019 [Trapa natans]|uniref:FYVE-type domain-containing protein n=1 Tax=Trapa natans TaxID=22666 RepID=A0AAN7MDU1_TRANT|nr:hypothetical protein SAY86_013019 [Trapa natans]